LVFLNMPTMAQPEAYIGNAASLFDEEGRMTAEKTAEFLKKYLEAFEIWVKKTSSRN
ncbi:MAG: ACP phosphodiesterase, partial [Clostridiales bacterium]|nr:ACP phosphodiesterase [Clostridiales bacterium]